MKMLPVIFLVLSFALLVLARLFSNTFVPKSLLIVSGIISMILAIISAVWGFWILRKKKD
ncbi:hypothetical protein [Companilactobacillus zhongbaensis]|uniref:hypothetical protein n=1 Tax=Companilactobacillus zhongbaensis TaxID=2486009 RepID=UPI000F7AD13C|nr:hypothetical protein [Companilactobacillus zhongbaensis]